MTAGTLGARGTIPGVASGRALVSKRPFTFAHGVDPSTGEVTDVHSDIRGENVRARVLVYPFGKGSTTASAWFLETVRLGNSPSAVVTDGLDLGVVIGSVLANATYGKTIPVLTGLSEEHRDSLAPTDLLEVDGTKGSLTVRRP